MNRALVRLSIAALLLLALTGAAGCNKHKVRTEATTEGPYLNIGPLTYQVQLSRQLNPADTEDKAYLEGVAPAQAKLARTEIWFAIFMRVQNETNSSHPAASDFEIVDTLGLTYRPVPISSTNPFAYRAREVAGQGLLPSRESAAANGVVGEGAALLFKVKLASLSNRPLLLHIRSPEVPQKVGTVTLDV